MTNNTDCIIIIPIYKTNLEFRRFVTIANTYNLYKDKYDIYFICGKSLDISKYKLFFPNIPYKFYNDNYFRGQDEYSELMLSSFFYEEYINYKYILIAQDDAYITNRLNLEYFLNKKYDYIGALSNIPYDLNIDDLMYAYNNNLTLGDFNKQHNYHLFMNGGLSLRKTDVLYNVLKNHKDVGVEWEDDVICNILNENNNLYNTILVKDIIYFGYEDYDHITFNIYKSNNIVPFGIHNTYEQFIENI